MKNVKSLFSVHSLIRKFSQEAKSLDEAKILAKWNFLKGYEIIDIMGKIVERKEHFCPWCRKCSCEHLFSEHLHEPNKPEKCTEKKCQCKQFVHKETDLKY